MMAARSRPRSSFASDDIGGETQLWSSIVDKIKRCHAINQKSEVLSKDLVSYEEQIKESSARDAVSKLGELEKLYREGIKLSEEEAKVLHEEPDDLLRNLETLISVRSALEAETPRATQPNPRTLKRSKPDTDGALDSPTPAPEVLTPISATRPLIKQTSRSGSVASNAPVKIESGSEQLESIKSVVSMDKPKFAINDEVFYRHRGKDREGEGIQCRVTDVVGEGKLRRYVIQDIEPESNEQVPSYRASAQSLLAIPGPGTPLPDLQKGKQVFALYPATTTFYKAELVRHSKDTCRLRFEGEEEKNKEQDVDRRYVLDVK